MGGWARGKKKKKKWRSEKEKKKERRKGRKSGECIAREDDTRVSVDTRCYYLSTCVDILDRRSHTTYEHTQRDIFIPIFSTHRIITGVRRARAGTTHADTHNRAHQHTSLEPKGERGGESRTERTTKEENYQRDEEEWDSRESVPGNDARCSRGDTKEGKERGGETPKLKISLSSPFFFFLPRFFSLFRRLLIISRPTKYTFSTFVTQATVPLPPVN